MQQPEVADSRHYVTLDDIGALSVAQSDPKGFLPTEGPLTIGRRYLPFEIKASQTVTASEAVLIER